MDQWLAKNLVCPRDYSELEEGNQRLTCSSNHSYPIVEGIPVMLVEEATPTHSSCVSSLSLAKSVESHGDLEDYSPAQGGVDAFVQRMVGGTCGGMYSNLTNRLKRYPIPELRLPKGSGQRFLDIGCNWGRWSISAARNGYATVGIDASLDAVWAAKRVAQQLDASICYAVADARYLPFRASSLDVAFSNNVFQHFGKDDVRQSLMSVARTLKPSGTCLIQITNSLGLRNFYRRLRRGFREPTHFDARYWTPWELKSTFNAMIGPTTIFVDGYFSVNAQAKDLDLLPLRYRPVVVSSYLLRKMSERLHWMTYFADSLYVKSIRASE